MKNIINKISPKFMLTILMAITLNFSTMADNTSDQPFDNSSSNSDMWGSSKSTLFDNSTTPANAGTKMNAPALPDEPGATCVPVPIGTMALLGMAFIYGLVVLYRTKREKMNS